MSEKAYKIIVRSVKGKDGRKFNTYKIVDEENHGKLVDCVMCKSVGDETVKKITEAKKCFIKGDISISNNFEYPKAFIRSVTEITEA